MDLKTTIFLVLAIGDTLLAINIYLLPQITFKFATTKTLSIRIHNYYNLANMYLTRAGLYVYFYLIHALVAIAAYLTKTGPSWLPFVAFPLSLIMIKMSLKWDYNQKFGGGKAKGLNNWIFTILWIVMIVYLWFLYASSRI
ncbi:hypothetical protein ACFL1A_03040 [Patescibacteria group bacterium]